MVDFANGAFSVARIAFTSTGSRNNAALLRESSVAFYCAVAINTATAEKPVAKIFLMCVIA
jgi:hypothetical protein